MNALALYGRYVAASLRAQAQYPAATLMLTVGHCAATAIEILGVFALFDRFGPVGGWSFGEAALFYALVNIAFSLADLLTRGFEVFGTDFVRTGAFDRVLLRPRAAALQLAGHEVRLSRLGRLLQGFAVLILASSLVPITWDAAAVATAVWAVAGGVALFVGILVLQATLAFWTVESLEIVNVLTYGGVQAAQYPLNIYAAWFRRLLTFGIPLACVAYYPVVAILKRPDPLGAPDWLLPLAPIAGFAFLALSFVAWCAGIALVDGGILVADAGNNRIMAWLSVPKVNGRPCDLVLGQAGAVVGDNQFRVEEAFHAQTVADRAGTVRGVEAEQPRLDLLDGETADRTGEARGKHCPFLGVGVFGIDGRQRAVAEQNGRHAVPHRLAQARIEKDLGVVVRVHIDEARDDPLAGRIDDVGAAGLVERFGGHRDHDAVANAQRAALWAGAGSVEPQAVANDHVVGHADDGTKDSECLQSFVTIGSNP